MLLLICQQLKPSGFDCAPSILCRVILSTLQLTYLRVAPWVSSPCHLLPLGESSAMMAYRQAYQLALVSEPHDQEGLTWKGLIRSTERWKGKEAAAPSRRAAVLCLEMPEPADIKAKSVPPVEHSVCHTNTCLTCMGNL